MSGRTAREARVGFLTALQRALSCLTPAQVLARPAAPGRFEVLTLSDDVVRLLRHDGPPLLLSALQRFQVVEEGAVGRWRVRVRAYHYRLDDADEREIAAWHWHPGHRSRERQPHVHVRGGLLDNAHLPTGHVGAERVLRLLLTDLGVRARRPDWITVLAEAEEVLWDTR